MRIARWLLWLYPRAWRKRYGVELAALVEDSGVSARGLLDLIRGALVERGRSMMGFGVIAGVRREPWVLSPVVLGLVVAGAIAFSIPDQYISQAVLRLSASAAGVDWDKRVLSAARSTLDTDRLVRTMSTHGLYRSERGKRPMNDLVGHMRGNIIISTTRSTASGGTPAFTVGFRYPDRSVARKVADDLVKSFLTADAGIEMVRSAAVPESPVSPARPRIVLVGFVCGALLAGAVLFWRLRRYPGPAIQ